MGSDTTDEPILDPDIATILRLIYLLTWPSKYLEAVDLYIQAMVVTNRIDSVIQLNKRTDLSGLTSDHRHQVLKLS